MRGLQTPALCPHSRATPQSQVDLSPQEELPAQHQPHQAKRSTYPTGAPHPCRAARTIPIRRGRGCASGETRGNQGPCHRAVLPSPHPQLCSPFSFLFFSFLVFKGPSSWPPDPGADGGWWGQGWAASCGRAGEGAGTPGFQHTRTYTQRKRRGHSDGTYRHTMGTLIDRHGVHTPTHPLGLQRH